MCSPYRIVLSTLPANFAVQIAHTLVSENLAACVNILPQVTSIYAWQDKIEHASEVQLLIKTRKECIASLTKRLLALHPYDVPEMITLTPENVLPIYAQWLDQTLTCGEQ